MLDPPVRPVRILSIDDSRTYQSALARHLEAAGYEVHKAVSGGAGLEMASVCDPAVILVDGVLPDMDGINVVRQLRQNPALRSVPCVILTGTFHEREQVRAIGVGADAFISKQSGIGVVVARLGAMLRSSDPAESRGRRHVTAHVLVVDESEAFLQEAARELGHDGYEVVLVRSGAECLEAIPAQRFSAILLDIDLPGMSGIDLCRELRGLHHCAETPILALTSRDDPQTAVRCLEAGADDCVTKSSGFGILRARLSAQIRRRQIEYEHRDFTRQLSQKEAEAARERAAREVAEARNELTADLEQKNLELEQLAQELGRARLQAEVATQAKSEFLAHMSHEIRTPLNGVLGVLEILDGTPLQDSQKDLLGTARRAANHLLSVINDIIDFSKIEAGKLTLERTRFDLLDDVVRDVVDLFASNAAEKGVDLVARFPESVPRQVFGDPVRIRQVLGNLVSNAVKFTSEGHVRVSVEPWDPAAPKAGHVALRFVVQDTGGGIDGAQLARIFDEFGQADASTSRRFGGSGLGLAISRRIVEALGGELRGEGALGEGARFECSLELELDDQPRRDTRPILRPEAVSVIAICGSAAVRQNLEEILADMGTEARLTAGCEAGLAALRERLGDRPAGQVPVMLVGQDPADGEAADVPRVVLADPALASTPLVLLTSASEPPDPGRVASMGFGAYLARPIWAADLRSVLRSLLEIVPGGRANTQLIRRRSLGRPAETEEAVPSTIVGAPLILVVDDSADNLTVCRLLLERCGCRVDVAGSGLEAIDALGAREYDLILLDVHMPGLDGMETTRRMRRMQGPDGRVPIIALTADVTATARDRCLAAGMDDFLLKPVSGGFLRQVLERWLDNPWSSAWDDEGQFASIATEQVIAFDRLRILQHLADAERPGQFAQMIRTVLTNLQAGREQLDSHLLDNALTELAATAHRMKGVAGTYGAERLMGALQTVESSEDLRTVRRLMPRLDAELAAALRALEELLAEPTTG